MNKLFTTKEYFINFFVFNLLFLFLQLIYIFCSESSFIHAISYPKTVYFGLLEAFAIQLLLYCMLSLLQTGLLWGIAPYFQSKKKLDYGQLNIYFLSVIALITLNCYFFPLSKFSRIFLPQIPISFFNLFLIISLAILSSLALIALWRWFQRSPLFLVCIATIIVVIVFIPQPFHPAPFTNNPKQPNLIIIGVDSLSPNIITSRQTPNLYHFLKESVHFEETISPLARTYSAWTTILTGLYPIHHFARENLYPAKMVKHSASFAWNLQKRGYQTIFASDDRRFNNLGKEFGFQKIIGPHIGVNDVLLGSFYDFPLSNLIINLRISHWLLPYNYTNRAGHFSYYPSTFDRALQIAIEQVNRKKPLFMAVHFTLPHWPYAWAISSPAKVNDEYNVYDRGGLYHDAIQQADNQVGKLLRLLKNTGALNNSMVIVLSDHGEVLYKKGSRKTSLKNYQGHLPSHFVDYLKRKTYTELEKSAGHGSDLLSPAQYHCLLGFKIFQQGLMITKAQTITTRVALLDIAPTIAAFFHFSLKEVPDGLSLLDTIMKQTQPLQHRAFMLESGMLPNQSLSKEKVIEYAQSIFEVNPRNSRVEIRQDKFAKINAMKLYGMIQDNWLVALYPDDKRYITVLLNLNNNFWTDDLDSDFAKLSPVQNMLKNLRKFYTYDLSKYPEVACCRIENAS
jgi:hypothetical protein